MDIHATQNGISESASREEAITHLLRVGSEVRTAYQRLRDAEAAREHRTTSVPTTTGAVRIAPGF